MVLVLVDFKAAIAASCEEGRHVGKSQAPSLMEGITAREKKDGKGAVRLGWVKAHMGILGNEAADVLAKQAAEGVP